MKIKLKGVDDLIYKLKKSPAILEASLMSAATKSVLDIRKASQEFTPVDTGNLRGSIRSRVLKNKQGRITGEVWYTADYALYVHEMTWTKLKSGRHKFLEHAFYLSLGRIKRNLLMSLRKGLKKVAE